MLLHKSDIEQLDKIFRINLINSISGIKPANLIGTRSKELQDNVAIFSSVVHLGSNPAQFGMVMRPQTDILKDSYANIMETGFYTINHVSSAFVEKAHYTSAKFDASVSEFEKVLLKPSFIEDFFAPFVHESPVKIGMKYLESFDLPNACIFIVGEVVLLQLPDASVDGTGQLDLLATDSVGIAGLDTYYAFEQIKRLPYAREEGLPDFEKME
jgi:flavin reductase (DIM6/NTAB) family NADH-FMN oxidoreductase RutF